MLPCLSVGSWGPGELEVYEAKAQLARGFTGFLRVQFQSVTLSSGKAFLLTQIKFGAFAKQSEYLSAFSGEID